MAANLRRLLQPLRLSLSLAKLPAIAWHPSVASSMGLRHFVSDERNLGEDDASPASVPPENAGVEESEREEDVKRREEEENGVYVNRATGEVGGPRGPEPTRYGDWEKGGRCSDF